MIGVPELLVILIIVLVVFGPGKLPSIGDALGRSLRNFKRASEERDEAREPAPQRIEDQGADKVPQLTDAELVDAAPAEPAREASPAPTDQKG